MLPSFLDSTRQSLEKEICSYKYQSYLQALATRYSAFKTFSSWLDAVVWMKQLAVDDRQSDQILRPVLSESRGTYDGRWQTVLTALMWADLVALCRYKRRWEPDPDQLWANVSWWFIESLAKYNVETRPKRIRLRLIRDTSNRLYREYGRRWRKANVTVSNDDEDELDLEVSVLDPGFEQVEHRHDEQTIIKSLSELHRTGLISESALHLLIGTRIYGQTLRAYAQAHGMSVEAAKKCRQRAEKKIRDSGKKLLPGCPPDDGGMH